MSVQDFPMFVLGSSILENVNCLFDGEVLHSNLSMLRSVNVTSHLIICINPRKVKLTQTFHKVYFAHYC